MHIIQIVQLTRIIQPLLIIQLTQIMQIIPRIQLVQTRRLPGLSYVDN